MKVKPWSLHGGTAEHRLDQQRLSSKALLSLFYSWPIIKTHRFNYCLHVLNLGFLTPAHTHIHGRVPVLDYLVKTTAKLAITLAGYWQHNQSFWPPFHLMICHNRNFGPTALSSDSPLLFWCHIRLGQSLSYSRPGCIGGHGENVHILSLFPFPHYLASSQNIPQKPFNFRGPPKPASLVSPVPVLVLFLSNFTGHFSWLLPEPQGFFWAYLLRRMSPNLNTGIQS